MNTDHAAPPIPSRTATIAAHVEAGGRLAAVLPAHPPRALLWAHGFLPVEVWGPPGQDTSAGDIHLQSYTCSVVRAGLSFLLSDLAAGADLLVVPHTCDSLQGLGSLLLDLLHTGKTVLPFYVPRPEGGDAIIFLARELRAYSAALGEVSGKTPGDDEVSAALEADVAADQRFARLIERRTTLGFGAREFMRYLRTREYLPPAEYVALVDALLERPAVEPEAGIGVLVSGMLAEPSDFLDVIEGAGGRVVADDLACGSRRTYPAGTRDDPYERMAERLLGGPPDPTRAVPVQARIDHLSALAQASGARAVIFYGVKFCEPELFYLPQLRGGLESAGLRTLSLEIDITDALPHQVVTRVEALLETMT